jgi:hypothetical protein
MRGTYDRPELLEGITIASAHVKNRYEFGFVGHRIVVNDAWVPTETYLIFCDLRKEGDDRWTLHEAGWSDGVEGGFTALPEPVWVFGRETDAQIYIVDDDGQLSYEQIPTREGKIKASLRMLRGLRNGHAYAVSGTREVRERIGPGNWTILDNGIPKLDYFGENEDQLFLHGFNNIDGFSDNDLYASGGDGDLWHYDGNRWRQVDIPTNAALEYICCGGDGLAYITTNLGTVVQGRGDRWRVIKQDVTKQILEDITWYRDRIYISTEYGLFEIKDGVFAKAEIAEGSPYTFGFIDARDGVLLCVSPESEISYHDEHGWHKLIYRERESRAPGEPTLLDLMKSMTEQKKSEH